ncbi:MAG TPA: CdaR family protein [Anaerolineales bacterium]|nr:CdaR family protein [Anaerolineales bacterium]
MRSLGTNLRTLLWALILALAVWVAAVTAADPDEVHTLQNPVKLELVGQDPSLIISGDYPQQVDVTLRAPSSVWERINADPASVRAILDLSSLSSGQHTVNIQIQVSERPVRLIAASPSSVMLTLEPIANRTLKINLGVSGQPSIGFQAGSPIIDPLEIKISGAESLVNKVAQAHIAVNLDGLRENVDRSLAVELLDENGQQLTNGISLLPETVHVTIPISQQGGYRDLAVKVVVHGQVASGYRLANISVYPPVVTVYSGDPSVVNALPGIVETEPLDLQNANNDINTRLQLNLPAGVSVIGDQTVLIQAGISPIESSLTLSTEPVDVTGLPADLSAQVLPSTVDVIVSGPLPLLDTLTRQDVHVSVDVTGLTVGTHQLTPKVEILIADVSVESILPGTIEVTLSPSNAPATPTITPTPTPKP